jgi:hypothetical protein
MLAGFPFAMPGVALENVKHMSPGDQGDKSAVNAGAAADRSEGSK